ncbi:MAG: metallophosphoesterase [Nanoarchaeota archaeon]|nr:metallophosphoesterase [Nanoarchaeota archaeon]
MKILAIGDFHGKFPAKLRKLAKEVDLIISVADYCPFNYRKLWFEHCYGRDVELWEVIGKKKVKELVLQDLATGEKILKSLNELGVPVISIVGNLDYGNLNDQYEKKNWTRKEGWKWYNQDFYSKMIKKYKNILRFDYSYALVEDLVFIGGFGHTSPGQVRSSAYKKHKAKLNKLFKQFGKKNRGGKAIFVFHNMPYKCKLDKISTMSPDGRKLRGYYGSKMTRRIIDKYQPVLAIGGHIHENFGKCKIGKTLVVNPGAAIDGRATIIDFDMDKAKIKSVKFVK